MSGRKRYRLAYPERLLGMVAAFLVILLALILLIRGGPAEPTKPEISTTEESQASELPEDPAKASIGLADIGRQLRGFLLGILGENEDNAYRDTESRPEEDWQERNYTYCVVLDAAHGGADPGNERGQKLEKEINLMIAEKVRLYLKRLDPSLRIVMTRTEDTAVSGEMRRAIADAAEPDLVISLHCNSYDGTDLAKGTEALYSSKGTADTVERSRAAAQKLMEDAAAGFGFPVREIDTFDDYPLLKESAAPGLILEMGFLSDAEEDAALNDPTARDKGAQAIAQSILELLKEFEQQKNQSTESGN